MNTTAVEIDYRNKVLSASVWKGDHNGESDHVYRSFKRVMEYRREIAERILNEYDEGNLRDLRASFEKCNQNIAEILGL